MGNGLPPPPSGAEDDAQKRKSNDPTSSRTQISPAAERSALRVSMAATTLLAVVGVVWGVLSGSQIVLFDGVYAVVGIGLTGLALHASRLIAGGPTAHYPYGREALSPLVIALQGVALLATCGYGSVDAALTIAGGGSDVVPSSALWYGILSLLAAGAGWAWLRPRGRRSELLAAEAQTWLLSAGLSIGMVVAFGLVLLMNRTGYAQWGRFADPVLVLLASAALAPAPVRMIRNTLTELLEGAPDERIHEPVRRALTGVCEKYGLTEPVLRLGKVGPKLYVEVDFVVAGERWRVADADRVRHDLLERLSAVLPYDLWLNVELTGDPAWVR
ncbi:cation diffusion facilitator family transporter [Actinoplanes sp. GCM10030250]|uniref:cation diffusion facilitator family transporter n=1 Tax=Actinoplanes sp. GCM10030250 TaxID=3273376 RepID=UPI003621475A